MRMFRRRFRRRAGFGLLAALLALVLLLHFRYLPAVRRLAAMQAENETSNRINDAVLSCLQDLGLDCSDLVCLEKLSDGSVAAAQWDMTALNLLRGALLTELNRLIPDLDSQTLGVPLGNVFFPALLSGRGGRLPVRVVSLRGANAEPCSSFTRAGINQTLCNLELRVSVELLLLTPAGLVTSEVATCVPVSQTLIVGPVPDTLFTTGE